MLRNTGVSARVEALRAAVSERQVEKTAMDRAWVVERLVENVERAMQVEAVRDREGNSTGQFTYQGAVANKALELLGKELGMFQPKQQTEHRLGETLIAKINQARERVANKGNPGTVIPDSTIRPVSEGLGADNQAPS